MNTLYNLANLLSGDYDYRKETIHFNAKRHYYNMAIEVATYSLFVSHVIVFLYDDNEKIKREMVYYKINKGVGERQTNFLCGIIALSFGPPISNHRKFTKHIEDFKVLNFLFCYDEHEMQTRFMLNQHRAKNQVRAQILYKRCTWYWYIFYISNIASFILKFALENPDNQLYAYFFLKLVLYFLLFMVEQTAVLRSFLLLSQFNVSCLYLHNHLKTLIDRIRDVNVKKLSSKNLGSFITQLLIEYNIIIRNQKKINHHCEQNFYMYFCYTAFTIVFPIVILFENPNER